MGEVLLLLVVALTVAAVVFGVTVLVSGRDPGLAPAEPDGRAVPLPGTRPLEESDLAEVRFDTALRGYRMTQVDQAMRRAAYDIGYKSELIGVLEAEVRALREGRTADAEALRRARAEAAGIGPAAVEETSPEGEPAADRPPAPTGAPETARPETDAATTPEAGEPDATLRPPADPTFSPATDPTAADAESAANGRAGTEAASGDAEGEEGWAREPGAVVRSESA
ncbi:DivIVA domain-containing protein [Micromonospora rhizosphaerae]|uniref:DivIVA domain-containing protein n=1 Tax=Micromonospora rhizosphaerae TaxID=568872 RepID=A0A1C6RMD5_9ACTN|nr:DivIVA domain-containing protein [Micromonospora rhizosphaerae]SCL18217.1 DivIVA domain-containing protein [Micromonospora rhizosphaerae]